MIVFNQTRVTLNWFNLLMTGSAFKSVKPFRSGYFGASIKLQPGYTAGVITAFYVRTNIPD